MDSSSVITLEGNEAVAYVAYRINEVCAIYPITPSSTMAELADQWASEGKTNIFGEIPCVVEMQSEGGAAGTVHGALQTGGLTTTFTASQGLLLMIPNMYKIAGELTPTVFHVAARALAAQGLSIFGDHSDVAAVRNTGFAQLASASVQEAHDMALISQAASLESRIPFIHFFDGFRTSHEVSKLNLLPDSTIKAMIDPDLVRAHRQRALNPDAPCIRGTAQNPDIYFQGRETVNPFYARLPTVVSQCMDRFAVLTGRRYALFDYFGHPAAQRVVVVMGSAAYTLRETVAWLNTQGEAVGVVHVRLCLPFSAAHFLAVLPQSVTSIAVLDRTKTPGACGEPLYADVVTTLTEAYTQGEISALPRIIGGRYGLSSKEFNPAMAKAVLDELARDKPKNHFTIGIVDDVSHTSLDYARNFDIESPKVTRALFFGLGADGTVGANKNSIKIIGESTPLYAQGYFVYDSKKSGSRTVSHVRFGPDPIQSPYLIESASFIGCHQFSFIQKIDVLEKAGMGSTLLLNSPYGPNEVWDHLPHDVQETLIGRLMKLYVIDASQVARDTGMAGHTNTIMQTCFFALAGVLPREDAIDRIKQAIKKTYGKKGEEVVRKNFEAVDQTLAHLYEVPLPAVASSTIQKPPVVPREAPEFVQKVTALMMAGKGDELRVSQLPVDGTYPTGTTRWEKRDIALSVPRWEPDLCIQCGNCSFICPHSVIRSKFYHETRLSEAPENFPSAPINARGFPDTRYTLHVYGEDCTGCGLCVEVCPATSTQQSGVKAINMHPRASSLEPERQITRFFERLPVNERAEVDFSSVRGAQFLQPLFEFSGACAGCGETPYVRLLSQLFGDRLLIANATGCSSIYGGNLPTTPWTRNDEGRGPAWANSLFEDNAEFGLGFRLTADQHLAYAHNLLQALKTELDEETVGAVMAATQTSEADIRLQRQRVDTLKTRLQAM
ncbi:MAG: pyruvate:ferredoxin (flavodoxin) oxidoreductase, partial [Methylococcaceae bacterium]